MDVGVEGSLAPTLALTLASASAHRFLLLRILLQNVRTRMDNGQHGHNGHNGQKWTTWTKNGRNGHSG